jgi:hypothetical protein
MVYKLLELIMSDQVHTEDMLMEKLNIDEERLEELLLELESLGYLEENNDYFESTCDNCTKMGTCESETYKPSEKVKKIRVITPKALEYIKENNKLDILPKKNC